MVADHNLPPMRQIPNAQTANMNAIVQKHISWTIVASARSIIAGSGWRG